MFPVERRTAPLYPGALSVLTCGPADGPPVVLLHGIPAGAELFRDVLGHLAEEGYRALAPDLPGYGATRLPQAADFSLSADADRLSGWLVREGLTPVWLVGTDLGGAIAQLMVLRQPGLISHLALFNAPVGDSFPVPIVALLRRLARAGLYPLLGRLRLPATDRELEAGFADPTGLTDSDRSRVFWDTKMTDPAGRRQFARHLQDLRNDESVAIEGDLSRAAPPILLVGAAQDRHQPPQIVGARLRAALPPDTAYVELPDVGHFAALEAPELLVRALVDWRTTTD